MLNLLRLYHMVHSWVFFFILLLFYVEGLGMIIVKDYCYLNLRVRENTENKPRTENK